MTDSSPNQVVKLRSHRVENKSELDAVATTLSNAFSDDPIMLALYGRELWASQSKKNFEWLIYCITKAHELTDVVENENGDILAAAAWELGLSLYGVGALVLYFMWHMYNFGLIKSMQLLHMAYEMEKKKKKYGHDAYHLMVLGTDTTAQNMGIGSKILKEGLDRTDKLNVPCYLESSNIRNVPFYKRHGFKIVEVFQYFKTSADGGEGPVFTLMRREPKPMKTQ